MSEDKLRQASDPVQEEALKLRKEMRQLGRSCLEIVGSGNERRILNYVGEETVMCYKEVGAESCQGTVESVEERRVLGPVQEEAVEVVKLGSQGGLRLKGGILKRRS